MKKLMVLIGFVMAISINASATAEKQLTASEARLITGLFLDSNLVYNNGQSLCKLRITTRNDKYLKYENDNIYVDSQMTKIELIFGDQVVAEESRRVEPSLQSMKKDFADFIVKSYFEKKCDQYQVQQ